MWGERKSADAFSGSHWLARVLAPNLCHCLAPLQKIRTVELDGKVIKLQIVSSGGQGSRGVAWEARPAACSGRHEHALQRCCMLHACRRQDTTLLRLLLQPHVLAVAALPLAVAVGHGGPGALPHHHQQLLPRRARHHRRV